MTVDNLRKAFDNLWNASSESNWIPGRLGWQTAPGVYTIDVNGFPNMVYVRLGYNGDQSQTTAYDAIGAAKVGNTFIRMRRENGKLVIREAGDYATAAGTGGVSYFNDLLDVSTASAANGNTIQFNSSTGQWVPVVPPGGAGGSAKPHFHDNAQGDHKGLLPWRQLDFSLASIGDITNRDHTYLTNVGFDQHHPRSHNIITGDGFTGLVHTVTGAQYNVIGLPAVNVLGILASSANPGSTQAVLHTDSSGGISLGSGMLTVTPSSHLVAIDSTLFVVDTTANSLTVGGPITFNDDATFNDPVFVKDNATFSVGVATFNTAPQINANLNFTGADRTITSTANTDVTISLGTTANPADLMLADPQEFRSVTYQDGIPIAGFSLFNNPGGDRQLTINTIKSDSLHTRVFIADGVRIDIGEEYWGKSMGIVYSDFYVPTAINQSVYIFIEDSPVFNSGGAVGGGHAGNAAVFEDNDWLLFRFIDWGTGLDYGSVWGYVTNYTDMGKDITGKSYQRWIFTFKHGDAGVLIKKGNVGVDFGKPGQGYVHLSTLTDAYGPWIRIGDWIGSDPFTPGNNEIKTQIGRLDHIGDADLNPHGYGIYSDNAFLRGSVRTIQGLLDDDGMSFEIERLTSSIIVGEEDVSKISWYEDLASKTGEAISIVGWIDASNFSDIGIFNRLDINVFGTGYDAGIITMGPIRLDTRYPIRLLKDTDIDGSFLPTISLQYNLGSASHKWKTVYADQIIVTGPISGTAIDGQTWTYPGSMVINATNASAHTYVSVINQLGGGVTFDVSGDIQVAGTVDGIDISAHASSPTAHHSLAVGGDGISVISATQVVSVDSTVVRTPATVVRTSKIINTLNPLTGGGDLTGNLTLRLLITSVDSGLTTAAGTLGVLLATNSGLSLSNGLNIPTTIAGAGLQISASKVLSVNPASFVATTTTVTAVAPLNGGGPLSAPISIGLTLAAVSGLSITGGLNISDSIAGNGLLITNKILSVNTGVVVPVGRKVVAGAGLAGGGTLDNDLTFSVGQGKGIQVNNDDVQILLATNSGLNITAGLSIDPSLAGSGLALVAGVLNVQTGPGITILSDAVQILLGTNSGLDTTSGLIIAPAIAGAGLLMTAGIIDIKNADTTLTIAANDIKINQAFDYAWTGNQSWAAGKTQTFNSAAIFNSTLTSNQNVVLNTPGTFSVHQPMTADANVTLGGTGVFTDNQVSSFNANVTLNVPGSFSVHQAMTADGNVILNTPGAFTVHQITTVDSNLTLNTPGAFTVHQVMIADGNVTFNAPGIFTIHQALTADNSFTLNGPGTSFIHQVTTHDANIFFNAPGIYTFSTNPKINANLDFTGGDRVITGNANLSITPAGSLTLSPTGGVVSLLDTVEERSITFADAGQGIQGFRLFTPTPGNPIRQLTIGAIKTDNLIATAFTTDLVRLEQGDSYWGRGFGIVNTSFNLPAVGADIDVWFDNVSSIQGASAGTTGPIFAVGDKLQCRLIVWTIGISLRIVWFNVKAFVSFDDPQFRQKWTLTRIVGGSDGDLVTKGNVLEDAGTSGQGWIHVTSQSSSSGPYMEFGQQDAYVSGAPTFTQFVRIGQLSGTVDYGSGNYWGFATGKNLAYPPDHPSLGFGGISIDSTKGLRLFNSPYLLYNSSNLVLSMEKTYGLSFEQGNNEFNSITWYNDLGLDATAPGRKLANVGTHPDTVGYQELDLYAWGDPTTVFNHGVVRLRAYDGGSLPGESTTSYNVWVEAGQMSLGTGDGGPGGWANRDTTARFADSLVYIRPSLALGATSISQTSVKLEVRNVGQSSIRIGSNGAYPSPRIDILSNQTTGAVFESFDDNTSLYLPIDFKGQAQTFYVNNTIRGRLSQAGFWGFGRLIDQADAITELEVYTTLSAAQRGIASTHINTDAVSPLIGTFKARGSRATKTTVVSGDALGSFTASGWDGSAWIQSASVAMMVNGTVSAGVIPTEMRFRTTTSGGGVDRMIIDPSGNVGVGNTAPNARLEVTGMIRTTNYQTPAASGGAGLEMFWYTPSSYAQIQSYDRTAAAWQQLRIEGSTLILQGGLAGGIGIGTTTITAQASSYRGINFGYSGYLLYGTTAGTLHIGDNLYYDNAWKYQKNGYASMIQQYGGGIYFTSAPNNAGGAGAAATLATNLYINNTGNVGFNTTDLEAWNASYGSLEWAKSAIMAGVTASGGMWLVDNMYYDSTAQWKAKGATAVSSMISLATGVLAFYSNAAVAIDTVVDIAGGTQMIINRAASYPVDIYTAMRDRVSITVKNTGTFGAVQMVSGTATLSGYLAWFRPMADGASSVRSGYMGWSTTDINLQLENSASFNLLGGSFGFNSTDVEAWPTASWNAIESTRNSIMMSKVGSGLYINDNAYYDGNWRYKTAGAAAFVAIVNGAVYLSYNTDTTPVIDGVVTWATSLYMNPAGNIGIGNNAPGTLLHVGTGTPSFNNQTGLWVAPNATNAIVNVRASGGQEMGLMAHSNGNTYVGAWSNNPLILRTNNADRITIAAAGAVTIPGVVTASAGISFGQNTLTQYDESPIVWTPTITPTSGTISVAYTAQAGKATRVGNRVDFQGYIAYSATITGTGATTTMRVSLPFASSFANTAVASCLTNSSGSGGVSSTFQIPTGAAYGWVVGANSNGAANCNFLVGPVTIMYGGSYFI